jgi:hypothetical protein
MLTLLVVLVEVVVVVLDHDNDKMQEYMFDSLMFEHHQNEHNGRKLNKLKY